MPIRSAVKTAHSLDSRRRELVRRFRGKIAAFRDFKSVQTEIRNPLGYLPGSFKGIAKGPDPALKTFAPCSL